MKLAHALDLRRWWRCRDVFQTPLAAHALLSLTGRRPLTLGLVDGGVLRLPDAKDARNLLSWVLRAPGRPRIRSGGDGLVELTHDGHAVLLPPTSESFFTFTEVFLNDCYCLQSIREPLETVIDLGTNIGLFASRVLPRCEKLICVEPASQNLEIARRNVQLASMTDRVSFHHRAAAGWSGRRVRIFLSERNSGGHSVSRDHAQRWGAGGYEDVLTISLEDLFSDHNIDRCSLLKCDIEGSEYEVFRAASPELLARIDRIAMEVHRTCPGWDDGALASLCEKLIDSGFHIQQERLLDAGNNPKPVIMLLATNLYVHESLRLPRSANSGELRVER